MEKNLKNNLLLDFYSGMLTEKQSEIMRLYVECDTSLSEIARELNMSRQAVYDTVKATQNILENYEQKLKCVERYLSNREIILECRNELEALKVEGLKNEKVQNIVKKLEKVLQNQ